MASKKAEAEEAKSVEGIGSAARNALPPIAARATLDPPDGGRHVRLDFLPENLAEIAVPAKRPEQVLAERLAAEIRAKAAEKEHRQKAQEDKGKLFFVQCRGCGLPAIFLTHNPRGKSVAHEDWFSSDKPVGRPWRANQCPPCQNCGAAAPVLRNKQLSHLTPIQRFIRYTTTEDSPAVATYIEQIKKTRTPEGAAS